MEDSHSESSTAVQPAGEATVHDRRRDPLRARSLAEFVLLSLGGDFGHGSRVDACCQPGNCSQGAGLKHYDAILVTDSSPGLDVLVSEEFHMLLPPGSNMPCVLIVGPGSPNSFKYLQYRALVAIESQAPVLVDDGMIFANQGARDAFELIQLLDMPELNRHLFVGDRPPMSVEKLAALSSPSPEMFVLARFKPEPKLDFAALEAIRKPRNDRSKGKTPFYEANRKGKGKRDRALQKGSFQAPKAHRGGGGRRR